MKKFTFIIIPPGSTKMIKFKVNKVIFSLIVLFVLFVLSYTVWIIFNFSSYTYQKERNKVLSKRYNELVNERENDKKKLKKIKSDLAQMEKMLDKISGIMGVNIGEKIDNNSEYYQNYEKKWVGNKLKEYNYVTRDSYLNLATPKFIPVSGWISSRFSKRKSPFTGKKEFHPAVDIVAPEGRIIRAGSSGKVIKIEENSNMGKVLYVYNKWGFVTIYAHNKRIFKTVGDEVNIGDKIAEVGITGNTTGPHLHYQVNLLNIPVDPEKYGLRLNDKKIMK